MEGSSRIDISKNGTVDLYTSNFQLSRYYFSLSALVFRLAVMTNARKGSTAALKRTSTPKITPVNPDIKAMSNMK